MIKIRRETDYAIRCVYYLSLRTGDTVMADEIAREMEIPRNFVAKILQKLVRAGIVRSFQGVRGGFRLASSPPEVTFYDVLTAVEGPVAMNSCTVDRRVCSLNGSCRIHHIWAGVKQEVEGILKGISFGSIGR
jgi:Rrf2 family protein